MVRVLRREAKGLVMAVVAGRVVRLVKARARRPEARKAIVDGFD
jgi:hypothetical protein